MKLDARPIETKTKRIVFIDISNYISYHEENNQLFLYQSNIKDIYFYNKQKLEIMQPQVRIKCIQCKQSIKQQNIKTHIKQCAPYRGIIYRKIRNLSSDTQITNLKFYLAQLQLSIQILNLKIEKAQLFKLQKQMETNINNLKKKTEELDKNLYKNLNYNKQTRVNAPSVSQQRKTKKQIINCCLCNSQIDLPKDIDNTYCNSLCWHYSCTPCMKKFVQKKLINEFKQVCCPKPDCQKKISLSMCKHIIGEKSFEQLQSKMIRKSMNLVRCIKCKQQFQFVPGNLRDIPNKNNNLTYDQRINFINQRFICPNKSCRTQQCKQCKRIPYHIGKNCWQSQQNKEPSIFSKIKGFFI